MVQQFNKEIIMDSNFDIQSATARILWAKTSSDNSLRWTPLYVHMRDSAEVCRKLWNEWVPNSVRHRVRSGITVDRNVCDDETAGRVAVFLACVHDVGKAIPAFQSRAVVGNDTLTNMFRKNLTENGLEFRTDLNDPGAVPHSTASQLILERNGVDRTLAVIPGGHHGITSSRKELRILPDEFPHNLGFRNNMWRNVQDALVIFCCKVSGISLDDVAHFRADTETQVILTAITVVSDWIASNEFVFPLSSNANGFVENQDARLQNALQSVTVPRRWVTGLEADPHHLFLERFSFEPRPFQMTVAEVAKEVKRPGIMVVEAPMGEGKTEAALIAAEILMDRFGLGGIMFALPTQATADGLFPRIRRWLESASQNSEGFHTVFLAHGKSKFNSDFKTMRNIGFGTTSGADSNVVHSWFTGKRKGILADFVIGTVDQVLMLSLKQRHAEMCHLGLSSKVVIIDECHAYDAYMGSYLSRTLQWLGSYNVPTILLSATLPPSRKESLIRAYTGIDGNGSLPSTSYPGITYTAGDDVGQKQAMPSGRSMTVSIHRICDGELMDTISNVSKGGGYIGIIVNTVRRAQDLFAELSEHMPGENLHLLHSGFTSIDRSSHESAVTDALGPGSRSPPPYRMIVIGTQVMEQSMDLDFDVLFSDLCPVDLLLQRIGRLHRHSNVRPSGLESPICYVIDRGGPEFDPGSESVYGRYQLYNTRILLGQQVSIPEDVPKLVNAAYSGTGLHVPEPFQDDYMKAAQDDRNRIADKERRAKAFQIQDPSRIKDLAGWLDCPADDGNDGMKAATTVRDGDRTVEAILIQISNGGFRILPWIPGLGGAVLNADTVLDDDVAFALSGCKAPLPRSVCGHDPERIIDELRTLKAATIPTKWDESDWLNGELYLPLDEGLEATGGRTSVRYDEKMGMRSGGR